MKEPSLGARKPARAAQRGFVTTRWSLVLVAGRDAAPQARKALSELFELYRYPVHAFIRSLRHSADEAEDLTQDFFAQMLEKNRLADLEQGRGRFRNWLLVSVKHYLANRRDHERAAKRGGDQVRIELEDAEVSSQEIAGLTPEQAFERHWAVRILENALIALGEECARAGKELLFSKLKKTLTGEAEDSLASIAKELGMKTGTLRIHVFRFRRRYQELVEQEVLHTVKNPEEVPDELRFLKSVLKRA
jgi:RNA polymerase sigma-70 factor (ECF subfamily)